MQMIFATHNENKTSEVRVMLPQSKIQSLADLKFDTEIEETGSTLQENAQIKAQVIFEKFGKAVFADDTGLEVPALNGAPGVRSARYAGENAVDRENVAKLLHELKGRENRQARFTTIICFINEKGQPHFFRGEVWGDILREPTGIGGFGYDPVFCPRGFDQTFAQMSPALKNSISHRGRALKNFVDFIKKSD